MKSFCAFSAFRDTVLLKPRHSPAKSTPQPNSFDIHWRTVC